uniref:RNA-directed DNA polymerase n=1 Tax=Bos mutus grunniens TaxID=30521 RepID=A0A8B9WVE4_BOSMU
MPCGATENGGVMVERSDRMWSTGEGNGKPLQYSCLENPMNSMKRQNDRMLKEDLPRSVGAQYATGDQWRNNSRKNEGMEPKQKQYPVVDVTGDRSKVRCCKEQYCIGTWNVRSMNQGKLEVVKQEMPRVNVDILGISEPKWIGMGEFNSDDRYIYYCFRKGRGTRDQIANIHWIIEKAREFQKNIYFCFIDYAKAFDWVDHNKLWKILKETGIPDHLTGLLRNLYAGQDSSVRTGNGTTDWFQIGKGVCQGCILSPCLFNFYAEYIMRNAGLEEAQDGIKIAGRNINNLRYADDTTLMAESEEELKSLLMKVKEESEKVDLKLNVQKTKIMAPSPITSWEIDGETVETVSDFISLGSKITADGDCRHEIKRRSLLGRKVMTNIAYSKAETLLCQQRSV